MLDNFLERNNYINHESIRVKYVHLSAENNNLMQTIKELQGQILSLRKINQQLQNNSPGSLNILIKELTQQNVNLEQALFRLTRNNEELSCDILMKNQLICENENENRQIIANYEQKIYQLRISLQSKEVSVTQIEEKLMEDKEETYGSTNRVNLMYFNEMNEMRVLLDRFNLENAQLKFINSAKEDEISRWKDKLAKCQKLLKTGGDWNIYNQSISNETNMQRTKEKKPQYRLKLEEELTRYDLKYKNNSTAKPSNYASMISNLKSVTSKLLHDVFCLKEEKKKIIHKLAARDKQYRLLQEAYRKIESEMRNYKIEVDFYRNNFKQLSKVTTERKIKFYDEYYEEILPRLEQKLHQRESLIHYWKNWQKLHQISLTFDQRRVLPKRKKGKKVACRRNLSCIAKFNHVRESMRTKSIADRKKQEAIFSFINETHNIDSITGYTIEEERKEPNQEEIFKQDISVIMKPAMEEKLGFKKKFELEEEY